MASRGLGDRGPGALGHGALGRRRDHVVVGGDQVPGRLGSPGRLGDRAAERVDAPGHLGVGHERRLRFGQVRGEGGGELAAVEEQEPVLGREDRRDRRAGRRVGDQGADGLALVGGERGDVGECRDILVVARFGDDDAAVGVADQDGGTIQAIEDPVGRGDVSGQRQGRVLHDGLQAIEDPVGRGDVSGQRQGRVLHDGHPVAVRGQMVVDPLPAGSIDEPAVDQHYVLHFGTCVHDVASFAREPVPGSMGRCPER